MNIPTGTKIFEGELASFWFDQDGFLCALSKNTPRSLEKQKSSNALIREITGNQKVCMLADVTLSGPQDKETRELAASQLSEYYKALAIISRSVLGRFIGNLLISLRPQSIPLKLFSDEKEARTWLKQYV